MACLCTVERSADMMGTSSPDPDQGIGIIMATLSSAEKECLKSAGELTEMIECSIHWITGNVKFHHLQSSSCFRSCLFLIGVIRGHWNRSQRSLKERRDNTRNTIILYKVSSRGHSWTDKSDVLPKKCGLMSVEKARGALKGRLQRYHRWGLVRQQRDLKLTAQLTHH